MGLPAPPEPHAAIERSAAIVQYDRELSSGAIGSLWLARMAQGSELGRLVSVRRVPDALVSVASKELIRSTSKLGLGLRHASLIKQLGTWEASGELLCVSEHLQGALLYDLRRTLVEAQTPLPTAVTLRIIRDAARAGLVARQVARENGAPLHQRVLFIDSIVVAAFGETLLRDVSVLTAICQSPKVRGIPGVIAGLSPEELSGPRAIHPSSEVFSLGVLLWELLANRTLFSRKTEEKATSSVISQPVPQLDKIERTGPPVPKELVILVCRAIDRDPRRRLAGLQELVDAIDQLPSYLIGTTEQVGACIRRLAGNSLGEPSPSSSWSIRGQSDSMSLEVGESADGGFAHNWEPETIADRALLHSAVVAVKGRGKVLERAESAPPVEPTCAPAARVKEPGPAKWRKLVLVGAGLFLLSPLSLAWHDGTLEPAYGYERVASRLAAGPLVLGVLGRKGTPSLGSQGAKDVVTRDTRERRSEATQSPTAQARVAAVAEGHAEAASAANEAAPEANAEPEREPLANVAEQEATTRASKKTPSKTQTSATQRGVARVRRPKTSGASEVRSEVRSEVKAEPKPADLNAEQRWGI